MFKCNYLSFALLFALFGFQWALLITVSDFNAEGPPVPIPNTEVKLCSGDNTCLETDRKDSSMPTLAYPFGTAKGLWFFRNPFNNFTRESVLIPLLRGLYSSLAQAAHRLS